MRLFGITICIILVLNVKANIEVAKITVDHLQKEFDQNFYYDFDYTLDYEWERNEDGFDFYKVILKQDKIEKYFEVIKKEKN